MSNNTYVRIALKASRGDGDTVQIAIDSNESIEIFEKYITIKASDGKFYLFTLHNILYYKIFKQEDASTFIKESYDKGIENVLV